MPYICWIQTRLPDSVHGHAFEMLDVMLNDILYSMRCRFLFGLRASSFSCERLQVGGYI